MRHIGIRKNPECDVLRGIALFAGCTDRELRNIAPLTTEHHVSAGRSLMVVGEEGAEFFVIINGTATVSRDGIELGIVGPGSFFGELAMLDGGERTATVVANTDMQLLVMSRREFRNLHFLVPSVAERMLAEICGRLRRADEAWTSQWKSDRDGQAFV